MQGDVVATRTKISTEPVGNGKHRRSELHCWLMNGECNMERSTLSPLLPQSEEFVEHRLAS